MMICISVSCNRVSVDVQVNSNTNHHQMKHHQQHHENNHHHEQIEEIETPSSLVVGSGSPSVSSIKSHDLSIPLLSQHDSRWSSKLTTNTPDGFKHTIGRDGSLITSWAMIMNYYTHSKQYTPLTLLSGKAFETAQNKIGLMPIAPFNENQALQEYADPTMISKTDTKNVNVIMEATRKSILNGNPVLMYLSFLNEQDTDYDICVLCTGINEQGEIMINDPATGKKATLSSYIDRPKFSLYSGASARK